MKPTRDYYSKAMPNCPLNNAKGLMGHKYWPNLVQITADESERGQLSISNG